MGAGHWTRLVSAAGERCLPREERFSGAAGRGTLSGMAAGNLHPSLVIAQDAIAKVCRRHGVARLAIFGSALRDDFSPASDVDVLVEFPAGTTPSVLELGGLLMELRSVLGREVDLKTPGFISPRFRDEVIREAHTLYAA